MLQQIRQYKILRKIGEGGMGEVFEALDTRLGRKAAIKLLFERFLSDPVRVKRFIYEAQAAAILSHPNICTVYEAGESEDGRPFIAMELVEGETLATKIRQQPVPPEEIVDLAVQTADALSAAHAKGIVHRDIKPGNIMVTGDGRVKVVDFGLAKQVFPPPPISGDTTSGSLMTRPGFAVGTLAYMSPEQLLGKPVDHRTDLFSFGVTLYEMATRRRPFQGDTDPAMINEILNKKPASATQFNDRLPPALDGIIRKALEKDPDLRYQSALEIKTDLLRRPPLPEPIPWWRRPVMAGAFALLAAAVALLVYHFGSILPGPSAALLPEQRHVFFVPDTGHGETGPDETLSRGMAFYLFHELSALQRHDERLTVDPWSYVAYPPGVSDLKGARGRMGATIGVEVAMSRSGDKERLVLRLVDASSGEEIGRATLEDRHANLASWQETAPERLASMLQLDLPIGSLGKRTGYRTPVPQTFDRFLQAAGRIWNPCEGCSLDEAIRLFGQATDRDSGYALAYCGLGWACWSKYQATGEAPFLARAEASLRKAADIAPGASAANALLGNILRKNGRPAEAEAPLRKAIAEDPLCLGAYMDLARVFESEGNPEGAAELYQKAAYLRPRYWLVPLNFGIHYLGQSEYEAAAVQFQRLAEITPDSTVPYNNLGACYLYLERWDDARSNFEKSIKVEPNHDAYSNLGTLAYQEGRFADAAAMYEKALALNDKEYFLWGNLAASLVNVEGEETRCHQAVERAIKMAEEALKMDPRSREALSDLANYWAMLKDEGRALSYLQQALDTGGNDAVHMTLAGTLYARLGQPPKACEWLDKALSRGIAWKMVERDPSLMVLRGDPCFASLAAKYGKQPN